MKIMPAKKIYLFLALAATTLLAVACNTASPPTPTSPVGNVVPSTESLGLLENSLRIFEPLPNAVVTDSVVVRGEGRAFENTILVEVRANGETLGKEIVTTEANIGEVGQFTVLVKLTNPVRASTDGEVVIYTESMKDGSIEQQTSVPVKLTPATQSSD